MALGRFLTENLGLFRTKEEGKSKIKQICGEIKEIGRLPIKVGNLKTKIDRVLHLMNKYEGNLNVQWAACHAVSNISMNIEFASLLMKKNAHILVLKAIKMYGKEDWKICWLGCSALWNLARPPAYRSLFSDDFLDSMLSVLFQYAYVPKVVNTSLGAISNLALQNDFKGKIAEYIDLILPIINGYANESHICATSGGLLANLAVNDEVAQVLVNKGALETIGKMWEQQINDENFQRNTVAVLSNCLTADNFVYEILKNDLVEPLYQIVSVSSNVSVNTLVINCFQVLQCESDFPTTTLHLCCHHGHTKLIIEKLSRQSNVLNFVNRKDARNAPPLLYAAAHGHPEIVQFLIKCGANFQYLLDESQVNEGIREAVSKSLREIQELRMTYMRAIYACTIKYKVDLGVAQIIADHIPSYDMFVAVNAF